MNNTPRTDDAQFGTGRVSVNFARQLERELNEARKRLKDANRGAEINAHALRINADKLAAVTEQRDELANALKEILPLLPTASCDMFHHSPKDRHEYGEECKPLTRYNSKIKKAEELSMIYKAQKW